MLQTSAIRLRTGGRGHPGVLCLRTLRSVTRMKIPEILPRRNRAPAGLARERAAGHRRRATRDRAPAVAAARPGPHALGNHRRDRRSGEPAASTRASTRCRTRASSASRTACSTATTAARSTCGRRCRSRRSRSCATSTRRASRASASRSATTPRRRRCIRTGRTRSRSSRTVRQSWVSATSVRVAGLPVMEGKAALFAALVGHHGGADPDRYAATRTASSTRSWRSRRRSAPSSSRTSPRPSASRSRHELVRAARHPGPARRPARHGRRGARGAAERDATRRS